jgi:1-acyl-sn-glycerol-3-phosphate acyltransferase
MLGVLGTVLFMVYILFIFIRSGLGLRIRSFLFKGDVKPWVDATQKKVGRLIFSAAPPLTGLRIQVEPYAGGKLPRSFLLVSNHQSLGDIPVLVYAFPGHFLRFVTKRELAKGIPMISVFLKKGGHALISRKGGYRESRRELVKLAKLASRGYCPVVFPEGTRSRSGIMRKFQGGAFRILLENVSLPVLSVAIDGGFRISRFGKLFTNLKNTTFRVKALRLYPAPQGKQEILGLLEKVEEDISSQIREWRRRKL